MGLQNAIDKLSPLSEQSLYILLSLYKSDNHGYGVVIATRDMTNGRLELNPTTVYKAINRFIEYGLVEYSDESDGKKYYKLSNDGKSFLSHEYQKIKLLEQNICITIQEEQ